MKCYYLFIFKALVRSTKLYFFMLKSIYPVAYRILRDEKRYGSYFACSSMPFRYIWPMKESKNRTWMSYLIAIIKMVGSRIILIYCKFYKPKSQIISIKIHVSLGIASYSCNMVYPKDTFIHGTIFTLFSSSHCRFHIFLV